MRIITSPVLIAILILLSLAYFLSRGRGLASFTVPELGIIIMVPKDFADLKAASIGLPGDQTVNTVGLSTSRLEAEGCTASSAPLGYLTYDMDKGGKKAGSTNGGSIYYVEPDKPCAIDVSLQDWKKLETYLQIKEGPPEQPRLK